MLMVVLTNRRHSSAFIDSPAAAAKQLESKSGKSGTASKPDDKNKGTFPPQPESTGGLDLPVGLPEIPDFPPSAAKSPAARTTTPVEKPPPPEKPAPAPK
jgi:hypothetical protein